MALAGARPNKVSLSHKREKKDVSFVLANGQQITRSVDFAIVRLDKYFTIDELVFAEPGDLLFLGRAHSKA